jgi:hypothetical protein
VRRAPLEGAIERLVSVAYLYPFRCQLCTHRFMALQWGIRHAEEGEDKREYERIETKYPVSFSGEQIQGEGMATDISLAGCRLDTEAQLLPGMAVLLQLKTSDRKPPITVETTVVRVIRPRLLGLKFTHLDPEQQERLIQIVTGLLGLPPTHLR